MAEELAALERTGTWDLVSLPPGVHPITCKWVYKVKNLSDGSLERYKARLMARGFQQEHGRDYGETFALVAHMTTVRTLLAVAFVRHWSVLSLMLRMPFLMVSCARRFTCRPHQGILFLMAWYAVFAALSMALCKPLAPGLSVLLLW